LNPPSQTGKTLPLFIVDAFADGPFTGNPAAICPMIDSWLPDDLLQKIAAQNNLAETAFFLPEGDVLRLRWFAPQAEVDLCGHATLATASVIYELLGYKAPSIQFLSRSGPLSVERRGDQYVLDFPVLTMAPASAPADLVEGLGAAPREVFRSMDWIAVFDDEEAVRRLSPDLERLKRLDGRGVIVTAPGRAGGYVLRMFGPKVGIPEDPVTGSAQSALTPYWSERLGQKELAVRQLSPRGGSLTCERVGDRVRIAGRARLYLKGGIHLG
jgi:PhzF family phenazine biosynthesis protein